MAAASETMSLSERTEAFKQAVIEQTCTIVRATNELKRELEDIKKARSLYTRKIEELDKRTGEIDAKLNVFRLAESKISELCDKDRHREARLKIQKTNRGQEQRKTSPKNRNKSPGHFSEGYSTPKQVRVTPVNHPPKPKPRPQPRHSIRLLLKMTNNQLRSQKKSRRNGTKAPYQNKSTLVSTPNPLPFSSRQGTPKRCRVEEEIQPGNLNRVHRIPRRSKKQDPVNRLFSPFETMNQIPRGAQPENVPSPVRGWQIPPYRWYDQYPKKKGQDTPL